MSIWQRIKGGWKTQGPGNIGLGDAGFASDETELYNAVSAGAAMRLSAVLACVSLRGEVVGSLPLHLRDEKKNVVKDHDLYSVLHDKPNSMQTAQEFWSMMTGHVDLYGNGLAVIKRNSRSKAVISLEPTWSPDTATLTQKKNSWFYTIDGEDYAPEDVLHLKGFSLDGLWGMSRLDAGRAILSSQLSANDAAIRAFKQGMKVGGFFEVERDLTDEQDIQFQQRLARFADPANAGKFMRLLKGMKPVSGDQFRPKASDAELLASRQFGIEEACRLFATPPQLIGHSDKASSWASSLEQINLFFLMYSLQPTIIRHESRISFSLLSSEDKVRGFRPKFQLQGLLRADSKTQSAMFASALQNGYYSRNEVRDLLDRTAVPDGDEYTVQMNMTTLADANTAAQDAKKPKEPQK